MRLIQFNVYFIHLFSTCLSYESRIVAHSRVARTLITARTLLLNIHVFSSKE